MRKISYKVFLDLGGDLPGDRLFDLLQAVDQAGSINRAAADLKTSYRYAWGLIKSAEERLACTLLTKRVGGATGGGARLTDEARHLLEQYRLFRANMDSRVDQLFDPLGSAGPTGAGPNGAGSQEADQGTAPEIRQPVLIASTIGPVESGLLSALEGAFVEELGIPVRHIAAGSGQALTIAREGRADLVLTHAPGLEAAFLDEGYGVARFPLMYNDFLLLGPESDLAGARGASSAAEAFRRCAEAKAPFLTRGDQSGTHVQEQMLWRAAGQEPTGAWYRVCSRGAMGSLTTLRAAEQGQAYVLVDRATYAAARAEGLRLIPLFAGDPAMRNEFSLILVSPQRFPQVQYWGAFQYAVWATGPQGQALIGQFGVDRFGAPLFTPVKAP